MFYGKGDVLEFVKVDSSDNRWWKMKKLIDNEEFSMPYSHLKKVGLNIITILFSSNICVWGMSAGGGIICLHVDIRI